jgi:hypothetical protein
LNPRLRVEDERAPRLRALGHARHRQDARGLNLLSKRVELAPYCLKDRPTA